MNLDDTVLDKIFDVVSDVVFADGGDGDGWIISPKWKELASKFQDYGKEDPWFIERTDHDNCIIFANDQEFIAFTGDRTQVTHSPTIVVELPYA